MVYDQFVVLIDMELSDSTSLYTLPSNQYGIQKLAVLMVILKPNLLKNCFTTTLMHRLSQFSASQANTSSILRNQTCLHAV